MRSVCSQTARIRSSVMLRDPSSGVTAGIATSEPELRRVWGEFTARWMQVVASAARPHAS